jgi:predicted nucleotidyltransferase
MKHATSTSTTPRVRPDIITDEFLEIMRAHGVVEAYLFGSIARGEERPDSDIDLLVTFAQPDHFGEQFLLAEELRRLSGRRVDVATNLHPAFAPYINPTLVPLPL